MTKATAPVAAPQESSAPTLEVTQAAWIAADKKTRKSILAGLNQRALSALSAGELAIATAYAELVKALTTEQEASPDLIAAIRYATFLSVTTEMEANLSDAARELVLGGAAVDGYLETRLKGTVAPRKSSAVQSRAGSGEPGGDTMGHIVDCLTASKGAWFGTGAIQAFKSEGRGYTDTYRPQGSVGAILASSTVGATKWRADSKIEVRQGVRGKQYRIA